MKRLMLALVMMSLTGMASANCGNDNGNGNGCNGNTGPQGPTGQNGTNGTNGSNGANGANGTNGVNGTNGTNGANGQDKAAQLLAELDVRLLDTRWVSLYAFDAYQLDRRESHDVLGGARNDSFGAKLVIKLGRDYTEDRIDALEKKLKRLEALSR